jgi:toxin-antitoxin system PIN domain toxin
VIVPDVNLLLDAVNADARGHSAAARWLSRTLLGPEEVGFAWLVLVGFVRLTTQSAIFDTPLAASEALDVVDGWLARPNVVTIEATARHTAILRGLLEEVGTAGNLTTDAHLAALAIEHGGTVASRDRDFGRFRGLKWVDPLAR